MLEHANEVIDQIILRTHRELRDHRAEGGDDEQFVVRMMREFHEQALVSPLGAGARHMAMSVYRLVIQQEILQDLLEKLEMRDAALEMMFELESM